MNNWWKPVLTLGSTMAIITMVYNNCAPFQTKKFASLASTCAPLSKMTKVKNGKLSLNPYRESKVRFNGSSADNSFDIPVSIDWSKPVAITIDTICHRNTGDSISTSIVDDKPIHEDMRRQVFYHTFGSEPSQTDLANIQNSPCILGMSDGFEYTKASYADTLSDPFASDQRHLDHLNMAEMDQLVYDPSNGLQNLNDKVVVAVVDTGVDFQHPEIYDMMWRSPGVGYVGKNATLIDPSTMPSCTEVYDSGPKAGEPVIGLNNPIDVDGESSHGTHVAGIIAAQADNNSGIASIAGRGGVEIMGVRVFNRDCEDPSNLSGTTLYIANGIYWAVDNGADIINLSVERIETSANGDLEDFAMEEALRYAVENGVFVAIAAGNSSSTHPAQAYSDSFTVLPAKYAVEMDGVMAVGATSIATEDRAFFSHYSNKLVEISAPGAENDAQPGTTGGILSLKAFVPNGSSYIRARGTSMATPMVAAMAALVKGIVRHNTGQEASPAEIERIIAESAVNHPLLYDDFVEGRTLATMRTAVKTYQDWNIRSGIVDQWCSQE